MKISKSFKKKFNQFKKWLIHLREDHVISTLIKNNILFFVYFLVCVLESTLLRIFCMPTIENILSFKAILADSAVVVIVGAFSYLLKPQYRYRFLLCFNIFFTFVCVVNSVYYTFYTSFASVSMLSLTQYIGDVGDAVVENVISIKDLVYILGPICLMIVNRYINSKKIDKVIEIKRDRKKKFVHALSSGIVILVIFIATLSSLDYTRFIKQWNKEFIVMRFGIYIYQINDVITSLQPKINSMFGYDSAKDMFDEYFKDVNETGKSNEYTDIFKGKNVVVIHGESMMTNAIGLTFNGVEVTPTLNKLSKSGMYFSNFYSQVSVGTSSDSELTYNTSLLPTKSGTAFVSYSDRTYIGIPSLLKDMNYYTFSMHANKADFWNRRTMHMALGYNKFYAKDSYKVNLEDVIGLGLSDKSFFSQSVEKIKKINEKHEKWYGLLIMLSNHTPFSDVEKYGEFEVNLKENVTLEDGSVEEKVYPYMEGTKLGNYFKSLHYADSALGEFIDMMDDEGLLDNTVFILYGDHDARLPRSDYNRLVNYDKETDDVLDVFDSNYNEYDYYDYELGRKVPFIIWTKNMENTSLNKEITDVMGMYDVMPTLGNMFGFYNKYALGHDIFDIKENNIVVFPNGNWVTNNMYYNSQKQEYLSLSDSPIDEASIQANNDYATKILDVSNNIIVFDLLNDNKSEEEIKKTVESIE